ncbi:MAG: DUF3757 domain-containing protein [Gammaproteobacteria bacterium]|nr:DUF3757 domain-containing protein [Gammaproteobacteria bacterium]
MRNLLLSFILITLSGMSVAEVCPTVQAIKRNQIQGWKAYDSDEGTLLSAKRTIQFKKDVATFALAELSKPETRKGSIHCYYSNESGAALEAYLAKNHQVKVANQLAWYKVTGAMHCAAPLHQCQFQATNQPLHHLAKK